MFGSRLAPANNEAPAWVKEALDRYIPGMGWRVTWNVVRPRGGGEFRSYGCARPAWKVIECFVSHDEPSDRNKWLVLHEIAHVVRGPIPKPSHRRNAVHHDERFFRIAAKMYIDYDPSLSVLKMATEREYTTGKYIMAEAMKYPKAFMNDPMGFPIYRAVRKQQPAMQADLSRLDDGWFVRKSGEIVVGKIVKVNRLAYKFQDNKGRIWRVPMSLMRRGNPVEESQAKLLTLLKQGVE